MMEASDQSEAGITQTPGQLLLQGREAANFSVQYVAEQLRLTESYIAWLESDQFENLPPEPFVLGYYRAYARILSSSAETLIESYHVFRQQQPDAAVSAATTRTPRRQEQPLDAPAAAGFTNKHYALFVVALVVVWVLVSSLMGGDDSELSSNTTPSAESVSPVAQLPLGDAIEAEPVIEDGATKVSESAPVDSLGEDLNAPAVALNTATISEAAVAESRQTVGGSSLDQLLFHFEDECWLEVTDANDDVVAANLYQKGDDARLQGVAPFTVMLGNVRAVQVSLNGKTVTMQPRGFRKTLRAYVFADGTTQSAE